MTGFPPISQKPPAEKREEEKPSAVLIYRCVFRQEKENKSEKLP